MIRANPFQDYDHWDVLTELDDIRDRIINDLRDTWLDTLEIADIHDRLSGCLTDCSLDIEEYSKKENALQNLNNQLNQLKENMRHKDYEIELMPYILDINNNRKLRLIEKKKKVAQFLLSSLCYYQHRHTEDNIKDYASSMVDRLSNLTNNVRRTDDLYQNAMTSDPVGLSRQKGKTQFLVRKALLFHIYIQNAVITSLLTCQQSQKLHLLRKNTGAFKNNQIEALITLHDRLVNEV